jgi:hypothetical protein
LKKYKKKCSCYKSVTFHSKVKKATIKIKNNEETDKEKSAISSALTKNSRLYYTALILKDDL